MRILPASTAPWAVPIRRIHAPTPGGLVSWRPCLRWEFGFSCAFCLLHEADIRLDWGAFQVEPWSPKAMEISDPSYGYGDLFYVCALCNRARGAKPVVSSGGAHLLRPDEVAWGQHFTLEGDLLVPKVGDPDAAYTAQVYDLNDPRKVRLRRLRRVTITTHLHFLQESQGLERKLLDKVAAESALEALEMSRKIWHFRKAGIQALLEFAAIPADASPECRCGYTRLNALPERLASQTLGVESGSVI